MSISVEVSEIEDPFLFKWSIGHIMIHVMIVGSYAGDYFLIRAHP